MIASRRITGIFVKSVNPLLAKITLIRARRKVIHRSGTLQTRQLLLSRYTSFNKSY